jgi:hypothetical protein
VRGEPGSAVGERLARELANPVCQTNRVIVLREQSSLQRVTYLLRVLSSMAFTA